MKNYYIITVMMGLLFMGCTVDNDEIINQDDFQSFDATAETCEPSLFEIYDKTTYLGKVVTNSSQTDSEIQIIAEDGFAITSVSWGFASNIEGLPQNGAGIRVNNLTKNDYSNQTNVLLNVNGLTSFAFAANVEFVELSGKKKPKKYTQWVGDVSLGNSKYFLYETCIIDEDPCAYLSAGSTPEERRISIDFVRANLRYAWQVEEYLFDMLDEGVPTNGEFTPTVEEIIQSYRQNTFQTFITNYEITDGDCSSSVDLTLTVATYHDYQL